MSNENKVTIYGNTTCAYCGAARMLLTRKAVEFEDIDVTTDRSRVEEMVKISGQMGVPVIVVGDEVIVGFDQARLEELLPSKDG